MQAKDMTNNQLNIELAKLLGAKVVQTKDEKEGGGAPYYQLIAPEFKGRNERDKENVWKSCPEFSTDPVISFELQEKALEANRIWYLAHLTYATGHSYHEGLTYYTAVSMLRATPRQRAEAAYMTLKEEERS